MRNRTAARGGLAVWLLVGLVGCDLREEKPPEKLPPKDAAPASGKTGPAAPAETDPAAKAVLDRAVKAHTEGHPERMGQVKSHRSSAKGVLYLLQGEAEATRAVETVWKDKYSVAVDSASPHIPPYRFVANGARRWQIPKGQPPMPLDPIVTEETLVDMYLIDWVAKLVPLLEPEARADSAGFGTVSGRPTALVRVAAPTPPALLCHFDRETGLLVQVEYEGRQVGRPVPKVVTFRNHKATDGFLAPMSLESAHGGRTVEKIEFQSYTYGPIDPKVFEP